MRISKAWEWNKELSPIWLKPSEESYWISNMWQERGYKKLLDFGCGLGRHSIFFSQQGFSVSAFDLSVEGTNHLRDWAKRESLDIDIIEADMLELPYKDDTFDCIFAYHVISHTDSNGIKQIMREIKRVLNPFGEAYLTFCSKESWSFVGAGFPKIDENTVRKTDDGPEKGIPHFYMNLDDVILLFSSLNFELLRIRHTDDCYFNEQKQDSKHYFVYAKNNCK